MGRWEGTEVGCWLGTWTREREWAREGQAGGHLMNGQTLEGAAEGSADGSNENECGSYWVNISDASHTHSCGYQTWDELKEPARGPLSACTSSFGFSLQRLLRHTINDSRSFSYLLRFYVEYLRLGTEVGAVLGSLEGSWVGSCYSYQLG